MKGKPVITIDGPAGAGKSTVSRALARLLSLSYLDTGALYRTVAYAARRSGVAPEEATGLAALCDSLNISLADKDGELAVFLDGQELTEHIRSEEMSLLASKVSAIPAVRVALLALQRRAGEEGGIVAEGRDMGTVVFPQADYKFFLGATVEERARRRYRELTDRGINILLNDVRNDIILRDRQDCERSIAPLVAAADAFVIDSTDRTISEVLEEMLMIINR